MTQLERKIADIIKTIKEIPADKFYPALLIYERLNIDNPSEKLINEVWDIQDSFDSIYDEDLRYSIDELVDDMSDDELKASEEVEVKVEPKEAPAPVKDDESVEEKLGEFKKGDKLGSKKVEVKDFEYNEAFEDRPLRADKAPEEYGIEVTNDVRKLLDKGFDVNTKVKRGVANPSIEVLNILSDGSKIIGKINADADKYFADRFNVKLIKRALATLK